MEDECHHANDGLIGDARASDSDACSHASDFLGGSESYERRAILTVTITRALLKHS